MENFLFWYFVGFNIVLVIELVAFVYVTIDSIKDWIRHYRHECQWRSEEFKTRNYLWKAVENSFNCTWNKIIFVLPFLSFGGLFVMLGMMTKR